MIAALVFMRYDNTVPSQKIGDTPRQHIVKLFITKIPVGTRGGNLRGLLNENRCVHGNSGINWVNHYVQTMISEANSRADSRVEEAWKTSEVKTITYDDLKTHSKEVDLEN